MAGATRKHVLAVAVVMYAAIGAVVFWAGYLRSDYYRSRCAQRLSQRLGLPCDIGAIRPRSLRTIEFRDVTVWLPERRGPALRCTSALLTRLPDDEYELRLVGGRCEVSSRTWLRSDYRAVVTRGLRPGFDPDGPRRVVFENLTLVLQRGSLVAELARAAGKIDFLDTHQARAAAVCREFNGYRTDKPIVLTAGFSPGPTGILIDEVLLTLPEMPVSAAGLQALGVPLETGSFAGKLEYRETGRHRTVVLHGRCTDLDLSQCTAVLAVPWRGRCPEVELQELRLVDRRLQRLRFRGLLEDVAAADVLAAWGIAAGGGRLRLEVGQADISPDGIEKLVLAGTLSGFELEPLTRGLGLGVMTGRLDVRIDDLTIAANRVVSADAVVETAPSGRCAGWIETRLLRELGQRLLHVSLPAWGEGRIEYRRLGTRLEVRDELLAVFGTHGPDESVILTLDLLGRPMPVVYQPQRVFVLTPWLDSVRSELRRRLQEHLRGALPPS